MLCALCRTQGRTQPQQQCTRSFQRCYCPRGRVPCCRTRAPLPSRARATARALLTTTCGECSACCAGRKATHSRSSSALARPSDATAREAAYRAVAHAHLPSSRGKSNSSSPPHQAPPPVVSALHAVQAARPHTAAAAVHSLLPAMLLPERPHTVLSHTRTSPPRGREQQLKPSSPSTTTCGECSACWASVDTLHYS